MGKNSKFLFFFFLTVGLGALLFLGSSWRGSPVVDVIHSKDAGEPRTENSLPTVSHGSIYSNSYIRSASKPDEGLCEEIIGSPESLTQAVRSWGPDDGAPLANGFLGPDGNAAISELRRANEVSSWRWHLLLGLLLSGKMEGSLADRKPIGTNDLIQAKFHLTEANRIYPRNGFTPPYLSLVRKELGDDVAAIRREFIQQMNAATTIDTAMPMIFQELFYRATADDRKFLQAARVAASAPAPNLAALLAELKWLSEQAPTIRNHLFKLGVEWRLQHLDWIEKGFPEPFFLATEFLFANMIAGTFANSSNTPNESFRISDNKKLFQHLMDDDPLLIDRIETTKSRDCSWATSEFVGKKRRFLMEKLLKAKEKPGSRQTPLR